MQVALPIDLFFERVLDMQSCSYNFIFSNSVDNAELKK